MKGRTGVAPVRQHIGGVALVVPDYDDAIGFYVGKLGFRLLQDHRLDAKKR